MAKVQWGASYTLLPQRFRRSPSDIKMQAVNDVLHIHPHRSQPACVGNMNALLASVSLQVDSCGDVYLGLARLCRAKEATYRAVIVCLDWLGTAELEFFSVAARVVPRIPVYVYGSEGLSLRIARAVELGARGEAVREVVHTLAATRASSIPGSPGLKSDSETVSPQPVEPDTPRMKMTPGEEPAKLDSLDAIAPSDNEEAPSGAVQVPWLQRDGGPVRGRPDENDLPGDEAEPAEPIDQRSTSARAHEPLLTDEELQALIGDDVAAIAPDQADAAEADGRDDGGGRS